MNFMVIIGTEIPNFIIQKTLIASPKKHLENFTPKLSKEKMN